MRQRYPGGGRQRGFTLLEAIVALVLVGSAGMALFSWINTNIAALVRVQDANARSEATLNIIEYMDKVNPMLTPEGKAALGAYAFTWRATPSSDAVDGANYPRGPSLYQLRRFNTAVSVETAGKPWFQIELRQVGFKKVRESVATD